MKQFLIAILISAPIAANATYCNNGAKDYPKCTSPKQERPKPTPAPDPVFVPLTVTQQQSLQAQLQQSQQQQAAAKATAAATSSAQGGNSTAVGGNSSLSSNISSTGGSSAGGTSSLSDNSFYNSRAWALSLAIPAFTPPMSAVACPGAQIVQESAFNTVIGAVGRATASTDSSDCTLIQLRNAKVETCQYASAKQIEDLLAQKYLPGYAANGKPFEDYNASECALMKAPPQPAPVVFQEMLPPAKAPVKKAKRAGKEDPCKWQCVPKK